MRELENKSRVRRLLHHRHDRPLPRVSIYLFFQAAVKQLYIQTVRILMREKKEEGLENKPASQPAWLTQVAVQKARLLLQLELQRSGKSDIFRRKL